MKAISSARLSAPEMYAGEIVRRDLIDTVTSCRKAIVYIHAGAGYGKTTLLSQLATLSESPVWLTMAGENDMFSFLETLRESIRHAFPNYDFAVSGYLPFEEQDNFISLVANALLASIEELDRPLAFICDDLHTIEGSQIRELIACVLRYAPKSIRFLIGSREALWQELVPLYLKGEIFELTQSDLRFTKSEMFQVLGLEDDEIYRVTEGWPLAVGSYHMLMENGVMPADVPARGRDALYAYLFYECIHQLPATMVDFLKDAACFERLDPAMLDVVLKQKNTRLMLENLVKRSIFTTKDADGTYRYHALFRNALLASESILRQETLRQKAAQYYMRIKDYSKAAGYAAALDDKRLLQKIILESYREMMKVGRFSELQSWYHALDGIDSLPPEILAVKGVLLSYTGNFVAAKECLDATIPELKPIDRELYIEAMTSKARVLRNYVSFEESDTLLDELIAELGSFASEKAYFVGIEKIYNLCWESRIRDAMSLCLEAVEDCARAGNLKVKSWFERYLSAVYFFSGNMRQSVHYYEASLDLTEEERSYLDLHSIGIYAAKAYQMLGNREKAVALITEELQRLMATGKYEEMWYGYLFAAEIHYQNAFIDMANGKDVSYETTIRYFTLADEYATLFRKSEFQLRWAKILKLTYSLTFTSGHKEEIEKEVFERLDTVGDMFKIISLMRLSGYYGAVSDYANAAKCAAMVIDVGEKTDMYLYVTLAYGILARIALAGGNFESANLYTKRLLELCHENGIYEYFEARKDYDPILKFAYRSGIDPEITGEIMRFAGYKVKKAYIKTFGGFAVFPYADRKSPLKIQRKKERELLAFLLDAGEAGVTKEQICDAVWPESESDDVKRMARVYLSQIRKDLSVLGISDSIVCHEKMYSLCRDEIECDFEPFERAQKEKSPLNADTDALLLSLYSGEYLADFEAFWATAKRIAYRKLYEEAVRLSKMEA